MVEYQKLLWTNELETNRIVAKAARIVLYFMALLWLLNILHVLDASKGALTTMLMMLLVPLLLPSHLVNILQIKKAWVKYAMLFCVVVAVGICYTIFSFQAVLLFLFPTILSALYFGRREMHFTIVCTVINIVISHWLSYYFVAQPWIEPFYELKAILLYGALPRVIQYLCCAVAFLLLCRRTSSLLHRLYTAVREKEESERKSILSGQKARYEEREKISLAIHNQAGHSITTAVLALDAAEAVWDISPEAARQKQQLAAQRMRESLSAVWEAVRKMNDEESVMKQEDIPVLALRLWDITKTVQGEGRLDIQSNLEQAAVEYLSCGVSGIQGDFLQGALKECLTNSLKHGHATAVTVLLLVENGFLTVKVRDNGEGISERGVVGKDKKDILRNQEIIWQGFGLKKMKEFCEREGGAGQTHERNTARKTGDKTGGFWVLSELWVLNYDQTKLQRSFKSVFGSF